MSTWIHPEQVRFDGETIANVRKVRVERKADALIAQGSSVGPYPTFVDAVSRRVEVVIEHDVSDTMPDEAMLGTMGLVEFQTSLGRSDSQRRQWSATGVLTASAVRFELSGGAVRELRLVLVSPDGIAEPMHFSGGGS